MTATRQSCRFPLLLTAGILWAAITACEPSSEPAAEAAADVSLVAEPSSDVRVVILGTGTPTADPLRSGPAVVVMVGYSAYLVDAGPGVVRRAAAAYYLGFPQLSAERLSTVFLTHLHSDHTLGLPDLILSPWVLGRDEPLEIYGPPGTAAMVEHLLAAYEEDIKVRLEGHDLEGSGGPARVHEISPGLVYEDDEVTVEAFAVDHGTWPYAFGYVFTTPSKKIVVSGDTGPSQGLREAAKGADILVHEVYSARQFAELPEDLQAYHGSFHTSTRELAALASEIRPGLLVLYHQLFWGLTDDDLLAEVREHYDGDVVSARDLDVYE